MSERESGADVASAGTGRWRVTPAFATAAAIGTAVVVLLFVTTVAPHPTLAGLLGLAVVAVCVAVLLRFAVAGPYAPVAVTFWAFVAVWVGFAPLLQIRDGRLPWKDTPLTGLYARAQLILLVAVVAFWGGYTLAARRGGRAAHRVRTESRAPFGITLGGALALTAATAALSVYALPATGGLAVRFTTRDDLRDALADAGLTGGRDLALLGLLSTLPAAASLAALILCLLCLRDRRYQGRGQAIALAVATAVAALLNIIYNNPLSATRFAAFSAALAVVLVIVDFRPARRRMLLVGGAVAGLLLIYPLANLFRNDTARGQLRLGADAYYSIDFDGFQQTVNAVSYVDTHGYTWGRHLSSALLFVVPRSIWHGKAIPAGNAVAAARGYKFQNLALPLWAEFFLEFSWVGVIVLMFAYGFVAQRLDEAIRLRRAGVAALFGVVVAAVQIGMLRGPVGAQIPFAAAALVAVVAATALGPRLAPRWRLGERSAGVP